MSLARRAKKRDIAEEPIIAALEKDGWHVWQLDRPMDLLCWRGDLGPNTFRLLEVKTDKGKPTEDQQNFSETTGAPFVRTPMEALQALGSIS